MIINIKSIIINNKKKKFLAKLIVKILTTKFCLGYNRIIVIMNAVTNNIISSKLHKLLLDIYNEQREKKNKKQHRYNNVVTFSSK